MDDIFLALVVSETTSKAKHVLSMEDEVREEMKNSMFHPDLWLKYHREVLKFLEQEA